MTDRGLRTTPMPWWYCLLIGFVIGATVLASFYLASLL